MTKQDLQNLAVAKAKKLKPNEQIRLTADKLSYWVVNFAGILHIGYYLADIIEHEGPMEPFYPGEQEYTMEDKNGSPRMTVQRLRKTLN